MALPRGAPLEQQHGRYRLVARFAGMAARSSTPRAWSTAPRQIGSAVVVPTVNFLTGFTLRGQVTGANPTTIRIKAWVGTEPETWQYTATDSLGPQVAGRGGLRGYTSGSTTNVPLSSCSTTTARTSPRPRLRRRRLRLRRRPLLRRRLRRLRRLRLRHRERHILARRCEWLGHGRYRWCVDG